MEEISNTAELEDFLRLKKVKEAAKKANQERFAANSTRKLEINLRKKFQTTMVGALAKFEERFGHMWGHGIIIEDLDEEQERYREIWDVVRTEILNNGNNQLRGATEELARYSVVWNGYHADFQIVKQDSQESNDG